MTVLITEHDLAGFRSDHLSPEALLKLVERYVAVLVRVAVGIGKSFAVDELLLLAALYKRFDLVIYSAPAWNIINERRIVSGAARSPVPHLVVHPRPHQRCGPLDEEWHTLELRGCSTFAKATLCRKCPHRDDEVDPCQWPDQWRDIEGVGLVMAPEQHLLLNRDFIPFVSNRTRARRVLVILDEAHLLDAKFDVGITFKELESFAPVVEELAGRKAIPAAVERHLRAVRHAVDGGDLRALPKCARALSKSINRHAFKIQEHGVERCGDAFRYLGYDLALLPWSRPEERWRDDDGVRFTARPYLHCHVLVLSAHLRQFYVGHRLGRTAIESPFERHRFVHTGTRIFNLRSRTGADSYFPKNHRSVLDTFALLIARNIEQGRSTLLVSRKKSKAFCADYLTKRLADWGYHVRFVTDGTTSDLPNPPDPLVVPFIHYGVLGVNDYTEYESVYCVNSYYVSARELNKRVQEFDAETFRVELQIVSGDQRRRRVEVTSRCRGRRALENLANDYLHRLEFDPVIQAAGRARFATRPREVVLFQMADFSGELPGCRDVRSTTALRQAMGLSNAKSVDHQVLARRASHLMRHGMTARDAASELGTSRATLFRAKKAGESLKTPTDESSYRCFETPPSADGGAT